MAGGGERPIRFKPWIYTIARNRCLSMLRRHRPNTVELDDVAAATAGMHEEVAARADLQALLADLAQLGDDQRSALLLTELGDLTHAEVAEVLGCDAQAVKGIVFRARTALSERREARDADCDEIRAQLAIARGGALRRGVLRHHLGQCAECAEYLHAPGRAPGKPQRPVDPGKGHAQAQGVTKPRPVVPPTAHVNQE